MNDGTDTIRPATLRGLGPDQTLVLVNSKRRHAASLVNVNGSIGRGSAAVDMNTIPTAAISAVEVLRDGASAQYGSDAIAGVINVRLREANSGGNISASYGQRETSYEVPTNPFPGSLGLPAAPSTISRDRSDGQTSTVAGWIGLNRMQAMLESGAVEVAAMADASQDALTAHGGTDYFKAAAVDELMDTGSATNDALAAVTGAELSTATSLEERMAVMWRNVAKCVCMVSRTAK